jgi:hypothetical protein
MLSGYSISKQNFGYEFKKSHFSIKRYGYVYLKSHMFS